jgi:Secretion system C-terminal sorting domain
MKSLFISFIILFYSNYDCFSQFCTDGYTDKLSYRTGESVTFFVNDFPCSDIGCLVGLNPIGLSAVDLIDFQHGIPAQSTTTPEPWKDGFGYSSSLTWTIPSSLKSGYYTLGTQVPFIIKGDKTTSDIVVVCPTNTINAYSNSGGKSLYDYASSDGIRANTVSFLRPQNFDNSSMKGFLSWLYGMDYNVNVISDIDLEDYTEIEHAKLIIIIGHSEYWTSEARINFDKFIDAGKDALILSGNTMWWQVRRKDDPVLSSSICCNPQLICYKNITEDNDTIECNPLKKSIEWSYPSLKYSTVSSIGTDWLRGGYGNQKGCYGGFNGHKIILDSSPVLAGTSLAMGDVLHFATGEYDGTLIGNVDNMGNINDGSPYPKLDIQALGFYRAELIGYDQTNHIHDPELKITNSITNLEGIKYAPLMVFQKTCSSGKVINVSSNYWCSEYGIGGVTDIYPDNCIIINPDYLNIRKITQNMINLLLTGANVFVSPAPASFIIKPAPAVISYKGCSNGSIIISPCGVQLIDANKVDQYNGSFYAQIDDCTSCARGRTMVSSEENGNLEPISPSLLKNSVENLFQISPNPNNGFFQISIINNKETSVIREIKILDLFGKTIWQKNNTTENNFEVDISNFSAGIYYVRLIDQQGNTLVQKFAKQ